RVGGCAGWERATAHQIQILVIVRTLELIHHGLFGIIAHSAGPHDVAGADVVQANRLTVDFLLEPSGIVGIDPREFGKAHSSEQEILHAMCGDEATPGVVREIVGNLRPGRPSPSLKSANVTRLSGY